MKNVKVNLGPSSYNICIGHRMAKDLPKAIKRLGLSNSAVVITNPLVKRLHGNALAKALEKQGIAVKFFVVPDGEKSKAAKVACDLVEKIAKYDVMKHSFIIALGGGVIGDLAGFVASSYKRGVPYVQIPTTLLAQVDSSIGGKVGVDLPVGKNLMGAFYQPKLVWTDVAYLSTLSKRQMINGLAEVVKYGMIKDKTFFTYLEKNVTKILAMDAKALTHVVHVCSRIKAQVVMKDEYDVTGVRAILNFGHTVGHAIEAADKYTHYHHGEAVGLGMRVAADLSVALGLLSKKGAERLQNLITAVGLPRKIKGVSLAQILKPMQHDKKFLIGKNRFVLADTVGHVKLVENIDQNLIKSCIKTYLP